MSRSVKFTFNTYSTVTASAAHSAGRKIIIVKSTGAARVRITFVIPASISTRIHCSIIRVLALCVALFMNVGLNSGKGKDIIKLFYVHMFLSFYEKYRILLVIEMLVIYLRFVYLRFRHSDFHETGSGSELFLKLQACSRNTPKGLN